MRYLKKKSLVSLSYDSKWLLWCIICLGIVLRFAGYLIDRSLWLDEARLALNIVNRSFSQLLQPLDYDQGAPIGFLIVEKLALQAFGNNGYALRLFPFLAGTTSLFLFRSVAAHYLKTEAVPIALGLFAISTPLIYYSSEVKQYSSDVTIGLLIYWLAIYVQSKKSNTPHIVLLGVIGAIAVWFSHPAVFILAVVGGSLTLFCFVRKEWAKAGWLSIAYLIQALSFVALYFVSLRELSNHEALLNYWSGSFMPFPPLSFSDARWFIDTFFSIFKNPVGLDLTGIASFTFLVGGLSMFFEKKEKFFNLIFPLLLALVASGFHIYPFKGRLLLWIVPAVLLFVAAGTEQIRMHTRPYSAAIGVALIGLLLLHPLMLASHYLRESHAKEEIKPVISYISTHQQDGDILYVYYGATHAFKYYQQKYGYKDNDYIIGVMSRENNWNNYTDDLDKLRGRERVWILLSHINRKDIDEEEFFLFYLDRIGTRLDSFKSEGAAAYLYDLSKEVSTSISTKVRAQDE